MKLLLHPMKLLDEFLAYSHNVCVCACFLVSDPRKMKRLQILLCYSGVTEDDASGRVEQLKLLTDLGVHGHRGDTAREHVEAV